MTQLTAEGEGYLVKVGHNICIGNDNYYKITAKKSFEVRNNVSLTSNEKKASLELSSLKSALDQIIWLESIILDNNVKLWLSYKDQYMFGTTDTSTYIEQSQANEFSPYIVNKWIYNQAPYFDIEENAGLAVASTIRYKGVMFKLAKYNPSNEKDAQVIEKMHSGEEKCWEIQA